jgi:hypothetical protein
VLGWTTAEVRATTHRDLAAMGVVLQEEELARKRAEGRSGLRKGR